jgi:hypothetical protein
MKKLTNYANLLRAGCALTKNLLEARSDNINGFPKSTGVDKLL